MRRRENAPRVGEWKDFLKLLIAATQNSAKIDERSHIDLRYKEGCQFYHIGERGAGSVQSVEDWIEFGLESRATFADFVKMGKFYPYVVLKRVRRKRRVTYRAAGPIVQLNR